MGGVFSIEGFLGGICKLKVDGINKLFIFLEGSVLGREIYVYKEKNWKIVFIKVLWLMRKLLVLIGGYVVSLFRFFEFF